MILKSSGQYVFGLPRDPFRYKWKNNQFETIMKASHQNVVKALQNWISAKAHLVLNQKSHRAKQRLQWYREEVNGLMRLYLGCIEELYSYEQGPTMYGY